MDRHRASGLHAFDDIECRSVIDRPKVAHGGFALLGGEHRRDQRQTFALALAVVPLGILFIEKPRVLQQNAREIAAGAMGIDRAAVTRLDQQRQTARVIEVRWLRITASIC